MKRFETSQFNSSAVNTPRLMAIDEMHGKLDISEAEKNKKLDQPKLTWKLISVCYRHWKWYCL